MDSGRDSGSSVDLRTGPSTNIGEGEQFNKQKKLGLSSSPFTSELTSQDHFHFMPNASTTTHPGRTFHPTHDQTYLQYELHHTSSVTEKGDGSTINSHLEAHPANPFGEAHLSTLENNSAPSSLFSSSQNPFLLPSDGTNTTHVGSTVSEKVHDQVPLEPGLSQQFSVMQQGNGGMTNSSFSTYHPTGSLGETHHSSTGEMLGLHSSLAPSTYESSPGNPFEVPTSTASNTPVGAAVSQKVGENHDHGHESHHTLTLPAMEQMDWSMPSRDTRTHTANTFGETHVSSSSQRLDRFAFESPQNQQLADATDKTHERATVPTNIESHRTFSVTGQGHHSMASGNLGTDTVAVSGEASVFKPDKKLGSSVSSFSPATESSTQDPTHNSVNAASNSQTGTNAPPNLGKDSQLASESRDDDIPISSMPKHGQQSSDVAGQYSSVAVARGTNNGSETQNPPVQVMERPGDPATSSAYRIPSHVFARNKSNAPMEWSTASNESLFSIHMENMSFSRDIAWLSKSGDLDKAGEMYMSGAFPSNQPPLPPQTPVNKFNDISQSTAEQHEGSRVTEEKAAKTMREVIMETSITTENISKGDLPIADGATCSIRLSKSNDHSHHSDGSTKSFAFKVLTDGDKTLSSKGVEEKRKQQKLSEQQTLKAISDAAQIPKSTPNASQNRWLSCFTCCH